MRVSAGSASTAYESVTDAQAGLDREPPEAYCDPEATWRFVTGLRATLNNTAKRSG